MTNQEVDWRREHTNMDPEPVQDLTGKSDDVSALGSQVGYQLLGEGGQHLVKGRLQVGQHPE